MRRIMILGVLVGNEILKISMGFIGSPLLEQMSDFWYIFNQIGYDVLFYELKVKLIEGLD